MINTYIESIREAINQENWYAALAFALALPDICGGIEYPNEQSSKRRFIDWYDKYVIPRFHEVFSNGKGHLLLSGSDCYALRCSFLHNGSENISDQRAQEVLHTFYFIEPLANWKFNTRTRDKMLIMQVDRFCNLICNTAEEWLANINEQVLISHPFLTIRNPKTDGIPL